MSDVHRGAAPKLRPHHVEHLAMGRGPAEARAAYDSLPPQWEGAVRRWDNR